MTKSFHLFCIELIVAGLISGSANAIQTISQGEWVAVPFSNQPPPSKWSYETSRLAEGMGKEIKQGDLVKISLRIVAGTYMQNLSPYNRHELWVLAAAVDGEMGMRNRKSYSYAAEPPPKLETTDFEFSLGSAALRDALLNRRIGERFVAIERAERGTKLPETIPAKALVFPYDAGYQHGELAHPRWEKTDEKVLEGRLPYIQVESSDRRQGFITLDIEVLESCPARLFKKDGMMHQTGYKSGGWWRGDGGRPSSSKRAGHLQWAAVEAQCEGTSGLLRFEAGPTIYRSSLQDHMWTYPIEIPVSDQIYQRTTAQGSAVWPKGQNSKSRETNIAVKVADELDGTLWAMDKGITDERGCIGSTPEFIEACRTHVRLNPVSALNPALAQVLPETIDGKPNLFRESRLLASPRNTTDEMMFTPDSKRLLTRIGRNLALWDLATGTAKRFSEDRGDIHAVAIAADSQQIAWSSMMNVTVAELTGEHAQRDLPPKEVTWLTFNPDGQALKTLNVNSMLQRWDIAQGELREHLIKESQIGEPTKRYKDSRDAVKAVMSANGKLFAMASPAETVRVWNLATGKLLHTLAIKDKVESMAFSPDGKLLATGEEKSGYQLWNMADGKGEIILENSTSFPRIAFSPDGSLMALRTEKGTVSLWEVASRQERQAIAVPGEGYFWKFSFSPDGRYLATNRIYLRPGEHKYLIELWTFREPVAAKSVAATSSSAPLQRQGKNIRPASR